MLSGAEGGCTFMQVLEEREYARRKRHYKEIGQRHYYFMSVGNGEVVDACVKVPPPHLPLNGGPTTAGNPLSWCSTHDSSSCLAMPTCTLEPAVVAPLP